jgi:hypothetical protein
MYCLQRFPIPTEEFVRGLPIPLLPITYVHLQKSCPIKTQRGNLSATPLKKVEVKIKKQEAMHSFKNYQSFIS